MKKVRLKLTWWYVVVMIAVLLIMFFLVGLSFNKEQVISSLTLSGS